MFTQCAQRDKDTGGRGIGVRPGEKGLRFDLRRGGPATRACLVVLYRGGGDFGTRSSGTSLRRGSGTSRLRGSYCLETHVGQYPGWGKGLALGYSWGCASVCVCAPEAGATWRPVPRIWTAYGALWMWSECPRICDMGGGRLSAPNKDRGACAGGRALLVRGWVRNSPQGGSQDPGSEAGLGGSGGGAGRRGGAAAAAAARAGPGGASRGSGSPGRCSEAEPPGRRARGGGRGRAAEM